MPQEVDVNLMLARASIAIDPEETTDERAARLKREGREQVFEMVKSFIVFVVVVAALLSIGGVCAYKGLFLIQRLASKRNGGRRRRCRHCSPAPYRSCLVR